MKREVQHHKARLHIFQNTRNPHAIGRLLSQTVFVSVSGQRVALRSTVRTVLVSASLPISCLARIVNPVQFCQRRIIYSPLGIRDSRRFSERLRALRAFSWNAPRNSVAKKQPETEVRTETGRG